MRGEESGESSSSLLVALDGAEVSLPERPDTRLSDEEVCFPSLDRFFQGPLHYRILMTVNYNPANIFKK